MPPMNRWLPATLSLFVIALSGAVQLWPPTVLESLRELVFDGYQRASPRPLPEGQAAVTIVDIDEASLARIGQWPWPRTVLAELVERLRAAGARAIGFDMVFAEPDRTSPAQVLARLADSAAFGRALAALDAGGLLDHDARFAEAIAGGRVVTGFVARAAVEGGRLPEPKAPFAVMGTLPEGYVQFYSGATVNLEALERAAAGNGSFNTAASVDKVVRSVPLVLSVGGRLFPTLSVETVRVAGGGSLSLRAGSGGGGAVGVEAVAIGTRAVETDAAGRLRLHWTRYDPAHRYLPAWQVLDGSAPAARLDGRVVLLGTSAEGLKDIVYNPRGELVPGVESHAQAIEGIVGGDYLRRPHWTRAAELALTLVFGVAIFFAASGFRPSWAAVATAGGVLVGFAVSWALFRSEGVLLDGLAPGATALAVYLVVSVHRHRATEGERRFIRQAFQSYVSPNLVQHLLSNPTQLRLGGERRECSFVMTDLAGFTPLIEKAEPAQVVAWLNEYIDGMIQVAFAHEGTLDRIVGDAVAVMFSAPVEQPDHRRRALACAMAMDAFATGFQAARRAEGIPWGDTRIGVHCGTVMVGNFGGKAIYDYRALGDPINTAARLETVNKQIGTRICISQAIVDAAPEFVGRPVGGLVLKGKSEPIFAFEPLTAEQAASPAIAAYRAAYAALAAGGPDAAAAFDRVLERAPDDGLARFHRERLARGETGEIVVLSEK